MVVLELLCKRGCANLLHNSIQLASDPAVEGVMHIADSTLQADPQTVLVRQA